MTMHTNPLEVGWASKARSGQLTFPHLPPQGGRYPPVLVQVNHVLVDVFG